MNGVWCQPDRACNLSRLVGIVSKSEATLAGSASNIERVLRRGTVPGTMLKLGTPRRPSGQDAGSNAGVPSSAIPKFGRPAMLMPDNFWSNLKQFLFERPVKIRGDVKSNLMPSEYGGGFWGNVGEFFSSRPVPKGPINSRLANGWVEGFGGFGSRLKEFFAPAKQGPLPFEIRPIKVKKVWTKDGDFGWAPGISIWMYLGLIGFILVPTFLHIFPPFV